MDGTLILLPGSISVINVHPNGTVPIQVAGTLVIDGELTVVLDDVVDDQTEIPIISGLGDVNGTFTSIAVQGPRDCESLSGEVTSTTSTVAVLVSLDASKCSENDKGLPAGAVAGIVLGAVVAVAVVIVIALLVLRRRRPSAFVFSSEKRDSGGWR